MPVRRDHGAGTAAAQATVERAARRRASVPPLVFPPDLPVSARIDEICAAIERHPVVVVCGETGSGKTTQLPKACLRAGRGIAGQIAHTQPRRIAARTVAARLADELGAAPGSLVGFRIRLEETGSPDSLIRVMTDGILLAEIAGDRRLSRYDTIILDEAHERSLNIDFLLGYLKRLLPLRPELRVIVTSATIDPGRIADFFDGAPVIEVSGRSFPIEVRYRPPDADPDDDLDPDLSSGVLAAVRELLDDPGTGQGDLLVFLPGEREIRDLADEIAPVAAGRAVVLPLFSRLSWGEQQRVFARGGLRKVILATNVAETSITVPGVRAVIDTGVARIARYSPRSKILRLPIEAVSRASADQRKGRCGRVGPGICIRLFDEADFAAREAFTPPEILRTNLARVILQMEALGLGAVDEFPFPDPPDSRLVSDGYRLLAELQAIDGHRRLTALGRTLARLPVDPRLARMLAEAVRLGALAELLTLTAFLSIQDPRERPAGLQPQADEKHALFADPRSDFSGLLRMWTAWREVRAARSNSQSRRWCREHFLSAIRMREWDELRGQLLQIAREAGWRENSTPATFEAVHRSLLTGLLGSIGRREEEGDYLGPRGLRFAVAPGTPLAKRPPPWLMAASLVETRRVYARTVAAIEPGWVENAARHLLKRSYDEPVWSPERGFVAARETVVLYGLTLSAGRHVNYGRIDPKAARDVFVREALVRGRSRLTAPFLAHNRALRARLERAEAKLRRAGALYDEDRSVEFFLARLPEAVNDLRGFERWRAEAESARPRLLEQSPADVLATGASSPDPDDFPDRLRFGLREFAVEYRFEPGAGDDGATLIVPIADLGTLDAAALAWGVRGWRLELLTELVRGLPKTLRRPLVPAPSSAARCLAALDGRRPFWTAVSEALTRIAGIPIDEVVLRSVVLPAWLRLNLRVIGPDGTTLDEGRDLASLRAGLRGASEELVRRSARGFTRTGLRDWDFGALAPTLAPAAPGAPASLYPALRDDGDSAALTALGDEREAGQSHRRGVVRLLAIALADPLKAAKRAMAVDRELTLLVQATATPPQFVGDVCDRAVARACLPAGEPLPRDRAAFDAARERGRPVVYEMAIRLAATARNTLATVREIQRALAALPAGADAIHEGDCRRELERLAGGRFVASVPDPWLDELPRLLAGLRARVGRLAEGRNAGAHRELGAWRNRIASLPDRTLAAEMEWLLAEYCVSLFAQQLGTSVPVSPRRLEERLSGARR